MAEGDAKPTGGLPDAAALARRLCGRALPGSDFVLPDSDVPTVAALARSGSTEPHPVFAVVESLRNLGFSIADLCALCEFDLADGPLLGELDVEFEQPLRAGARYLSSGTIESYERIPSRRLGVVDRLAFRVTLATPDGAPVAHVRYRWLLPRGRSTP
ncbi:MAG: hypothetical protein O9284_03165 [Steroidobacteraceae bacterium]|nr:hypothetical protein [Steroidobacteraceae bacterium]